MSDPIDYPKKASHSKTKGEGVFPPKYIFKYMEKRKNDATIRVYYCKNQLIADLIEFWGQFDIIVQRFVIQKTLQPCVYRFYRNERNVFKAQCIMNRKSFASEPGTSQAFIDLNRENLEEHKYHGEKSIA